MCLSRPLAPSPNARVGRAFATLALAAALWAGTAAASTPSELFGVVEARGDRVVGLPATILAYADDRCVTGANADGSGRFHLAVEPGRYWLVVRVAGTDVAYQRVHVPAGSFSRSLQATVDVVEMPPQVVTAKPEARTAVGRRGPRS